MLLAALHVVLPTRTAIRCVGTLKIICKLPRSTLRPMLIVFEAVVEREHNAVTRRRLLMVFLT